MLMRALSFNPPTFGLPPVLPALLWMTELPHEQGGLKVDLENTPGPKNLLVAQHRLPSSSSLIVSPACTVNFASPSSF